MADKQQRSFKPLADRVLVRRVESEGKSAGGIIIPDSAKEKPCEGIIVAIGQGKVTDSGERRPLSVKEGDHVLYSKYTGTDHELNGHEHVILREDDILGVLG